MTRSTLPETATPPTATERTEAMPVVVTSFFMVTEPTLKVVEDPEAPGTADASLVPMPGVEPM